MTLFRRKGRCRDCGRKLWPWRLVHPRCRNNRTVCYPCGDYYEDLVR